MKTGEVRFLWIFVFFDLPTGTKADRRNATRFRNFLKDDGFMMLQLSVYARICRGEDAVDKHYQRVTRNLPPRGSVRIMNVTDRQYVRMRVLLGESTYNEKNNLNSLFCSDFYMLNTQKSEQIQDFPSLVAYHGEIGRETTAQRSPYNVAYLAYHGEIGRETTAILKASLIGNEAYHGEIGRETTAGGKRWPKHGKAYHGEIGRETTAQLDYLRQTSIAYHGEIGRETTADGSNNASMAAAYHGEIGRETTASAMFQRRVLLAYHGEIGRETTARIQWFPGDTRAYHGEIGRETTAALSSTITSL